VLTIATSSNLAGRIDQNGPLVRDGYVTGDGELDSA
jgi:hypothetical protein